MAVRILSQVWDGYPGGGSDLLALLALADWSDDDGRCWPSIAAIARKTRLSRSQAQRVVHRLIETGAVSVTGNTTGGAPGATRQYRINLSALTASVATPSTGRTDATGSVHATGRTHALEGSHPCGETGSTHATQTVSEPSKNRQRVRDVSLDSFPTFWNQYPRKEAKASALRAWTKIKPEGQTLADLMASLERQKATDQWRAEGGKFIPHPATWLNQRRWEDEGTTLQAPGHSSLPDFAAGAI